MYILSLEKKKPEKVISLLYAPLPTDRVSSAIITFKPFRYTVKKQSGLMENLQKMNPGLKNRDLYRYKRYEILLYRWKP